MNSNYVVANDKSFFTCQDLLLLSEEKFGPSSQIQIHSYMDHYIMYRGGKRIGPQVLLASSGLYCSLFWGSFLRLFIFEMSFSTLV